MSEYVDEIGELTRQFLFPGLKVLRNDLREIVSTVDSGMVQSYINLMNFRIGPMAGRDGKPPPSANFQQLIRKNYSLEIVSTVFLFFLIFLISSV